MSKLFDLLSAVIAKVKKTESALPKKLSDLENDLWYTKKEHFLTLTKNDFVPWVTPDDNTEYLYISSPKLEWLTSAEAIAWELTATIGDEHISETSDTILCGFGSEMTDDGDVACFYGGDVPFGICSGFDYKNWDGRVSKDEFAVLLFTDFYDEVDELTLTIYRVDSKKVPIEYCDTSEIEAEIDEINGEVI